MKNTIFAPITAIGGSITGVRISGERALEILNFFAKKDTKVTPKTVKNIDIFDGESLLDNVVAIYFKTPNSFTGEDVVEIFLHSSMYVVRRVLEILGNQKNCRYATNGEFSKRAFLNEKMDIVQTEGVSNLINSITQEQHKLATMMLNGEVSGFYENLKQRLVKILSIMEINIDFSDEEIPQRDSLFIRQEIQQISSIIKEKIQSKNAVDRIFNGVCVGIVGSPNVGKSSMLNFLAKSDIAIVFDKPGTTRDVVTVDLKINDKLVRFFDTAGIREAEDEIEKIGIQKSLQTHIKVDFSIVMTSSDEEKNVVNIREDDILVVNKIDKKPIKTGLGISIKTGNGMDNFMTILSEKIEKFTSYNSSPICMNDRHFSYLKNIVEIFDNLDFHNGIEIQYEDVRQAIVSLENITGKIAHDDVLESVFRNFCIGK